MIGKATSWWDLDWSELVSWRSWQVRGRYGGRHRHGTASPSLHHSPHAATVITALALPLASSLTTCTHHALLMVPLPPSASTSPRDSTPLVLPSSPALLHPPAPPPQPSMPSPSSPVTHKYWQLWRLPSSGGMGPVSELSPRELQGHQGEGEGQGWQIGGGRPAASLRRPSPAPQDGI